MNKLFYTIFAALSFLAITGCGQAPTGEAVNAPPSQVGSAPLTQLAGGKNLPQFSEWMPTTPNGVKTNSAEGNFVVDGDNSSFGYQITSPLIVVKPESSFIIRIDYTVESGMVCPGILTKNRKEWIIPASSMTTDLRLNSESSEGFYVVMANCQQQGNPKSKFHLRSAMIAPVSE